MCQIWFLFWIPVIDQRYESPNCFFYFAAFTQDTVCVGLSRVGSDAQRIVSATLQELTQIDLGEPLHSLIIPGEMHSLERDMLLQLLLVKKQKNILSSLSLWRPFILAVKKGNIDWYVYTGAAFSKASARERSPTEQ